MVRDLTGDWFKYVNCEDISGDKRDNLNTLVYFGSKADLSEDSGSMKELNDVVSLDRYSGYEQIVGLLYNEDPECRKTHGLDEDKNYVVSFNGYNSFPSILHRGNDEFDPLSVLKKMNAAVVQGKTSFGLRDVESFSNDQNALVYMFKDEPTEALALDWRLWLMENIIKKTQFKTEEFNPIIVRFEEPAEDIEHKIPPLSKVLNIDDEDLPTFFLLYPAGKARLNYPEPFMDIKKFSPDLVLTWAIEKVLEFELEHP